MAKILLVDDDPQIRSLMKKTLENIGHKITTASDGLEALGLIYASKYDLVLMDIVLPRIDGLGLLDVIKKREPSTMVVMISGQANVESATKALKLGAYDFLMKPFELKDLKNIVAGALNEANSMKKAGYIYKNKSEKNSSALKTGILSGILDSILLSLTYLVLMMLFHPTASSSTVANPVDTFQMPRLSAGIGFCYLLTYVFRRRYNISGLVSFKEISEFIFKNISYTFLTFMALMFLVREPLMPFSKMLVILSYFSGLIILVAERSVLIPLIFGKFGREGTKNLRIISSSMPPKTANMTINRVKSPINLPVKVNSSNAGTDDIDINASSAEIILDGRSISPNEILQLADNFKGKKLDVVIVGEPDKAFGR